MLVELGKKAKEASYQLRKLDTEEKNKLLKETKKSVLESKGKIIEANKKDMNQGKKNDLSPALLDRLLLDESRVEDMANAIDEIIELEDPVGQISEVKNMANGLRVGRMSAPMGVIGIIYESRPNVTLDAASLSLKSSNALILRGGKEAINSNIAIAQAIRRGIKNLGYDENMVQLIEDTSRESSNELMKLTDYLDLLIPRGSASLIRSVKENASVPVLETGVGNCHVFVDASADIHMALDIVENAKVQRPGVCNAMETLLVHEEVSDYFFKELKGIVEKHKLTVHGDENVIEYFDNAVPATEEDFYTEYLDLEFACKRVASLEEALEHLRKYSTGHSDAIVTESYENAMRFLNEVDSACVYVNVSTRFTDGGQLGKGAEMGISTQKLHARGPIGLEELTSSKFIILGHGQVRP